MADQEFIAALDKLISETAVLIRRKEDEIKEIKELNESIKNYRIIASKL